MVALRMKPRKRLVCLILALVGLVLIYNPPTATAQSNLTEAPFTEVKLADIPLYLFRETGGHTALIRELLFTADGRELVSVSDDKNHSCMVGRPRWKFTVFYT